MARSKPVDRGYSRKSLLGNFQPETISKSVAVLTANELEWLKRALENGLVQSRAEAQIIGMLHGLHGQLRQYNTHEVAERTGLDVDVIERLYKQGIAKIRESMKAKSKSGGRSATILSSEIKPSSRSAPQLVDQKLLETEVVALCAQAVSDFYKKNLESMLGNDESSDSIWSRHMLMFLLHDHHNLMYKNIGDYLGKSEVTVYNGREQIREWIGTSPSISQDVTAIRIKISELREADLATRCKITDKFRLAVTSARLSI